jgi:uncharacterized protein YutE (UPF0331/DUF86 family)
MVRPDVVQQRLDVLLDALSDLRRYRQSLSEATLQADRDAQHMVSHAMYLAIQAAIDLAMHALADAEQPLASTYRDAFGGLAKARLIPAELAERLEGWAGLRNILAHHYATIDYGRIHEALTNDLEELEQFAEIAAAWLGPRSP